MEIVPPEPVPDVGEGGLLPVSKLTLHGKDSLNENRSVVPVLYAGFELSAVKESILQDLGTAVT